MKLSDIGEFGFINRVRRGIKVDAGVVRGSGDDCAVLAFDARYYQLYTCDMIVEDVDFLRTEDPYLVGRKAVAINLSDIAACGGFPRHCVVSLAVPQKTPVRYLDRVCDGVLSMTRQFKVNLVGGDMSSARQLMIDISMLGLVEKKCLALRSQAKPGDIICVTGSLGGSYKGKHLRFTPRVSESRFLVRHFGITSMIDISDGLMQDLEHVVGASGVGATVLAEAVPVNPEAKDLSDALCSGEDFELLYTLPRREAHRLLLKNPGMCIPIGSITDKKEGLRVLDAFGREIPVTKKGYTHFS
ncbi:MAG TPA: thiamine-phosphate kinase [Candidatus Omnitrophota bacterium]|nr:thiamine-phosphate kinase [Candidatus Omnitrophota bacterium]HPT07343.1 thiamine-phosphate kinase [Candidatus Omnitrophota bacterium]